MNKLFFVIAFVFSTICFSQEQGIVVFEQTIGASEALQEFSFPIRTAEEIGTSEYEIFVQNGDGFDYFPQTCTGNVVNKGLCKGQNLYLAAKVLINWDYTKEQGAPKQELLNTNLSIMAKSY